MRASARWTPLIVGVVVVVVLAILPLLNLSIPGVLHGPTYTPGSLALMSLCMVFAALALSYNLLLGTAGMLSFGHALYFGAGAYGLGILLQAADLPLLPRVLGDSTPRIKVEAVHAAPYGTFREAR